MSDIAQQKDLVLNPNEYAYVLDKTKGLVSCIVGPYKMSLSNSDALVTFNEQTKRFEESPYSRAINLLVTAPENWYITLKNPTKSRIHPTVGTANNLEVCEVGKKINITGPTTFALYPGQMAKIIQGHRLRSNQYVLARVYDKDAITEKNDYQIGKILVIKGTDVPFYIPETGIEVISDRHGEYIRDAVSLERLEYCILKDENGNKKYVHGPAVVFPEPTEVFIESSSGKYNFKAIELSKISGIYVKVIKDYTDEKNVAHKIGDELFITGEDQMIYYPREEHATIDYDGKIIHHAIAIPEGEGRYILDRMTGIIKTVKGPVMYLPDPRFEVVVNRKLTANQCKYWYPGNQEVLAHNLGESDYSNDYSAKQFSAVYESNGFSRGTSYSKPRSITFNNKYDGAVSIDIWTGYAVNVISKNGGRKVIVGPTSYLMDYDETLEVLEMSTGKPKTTDNLLKTVYLRVDNNKVSDLINVETKDYVKAEIKLSYCLEFAKGHEDKWFSVENYVKFMTDRMRSLLKREVKNYTIEEFYSKTADIVRKVVLNLSAEATVEKVESKRKAGRFFDSNGMLVTDVEILSTTIDRRVSAILEERQSEVIKKTLELTDAEQLLNAKAKIIELKKRTLELEEGLSKKELEIEKEAALERLKVRAEQEKIQSENTKATKTQELEIQSIMNKINEEEIARKTLRTENDLKAKQREIELKAMENDSYAKKVKEIMESISPDLVAALTSKSNADMLAAVTSSMAPLAIANGESVSETTNRLLRGTSLEGLLTK